MNSSGLLALKSSLKEYFLIQDIPAEVFLGLRARNWWQKSRVVLMTGKFDGSDTPRPMAAGQFGPPTKKSSNNPRELAEWNREVTVSIFAVDPTNTTSEEAQNTALENLIEWTIQGLWTATVAPQPVGALLANLKAPNVGGPSIEWGDSLWMQPPLEGAFGRELLLYITYRTPFYDQTQGTQTVKIGAITPTLT